MKNVIIGFLLLLFSFSGFSQNEQSEFLEAKRLYSSRQYLSARAAFSNLARSNSPLAPYAGFYYGLSAFRMDDIDQAVRMWEQMLQMFPNWDKRNELLYWLAYAHFVDGQYEPAIGYATQLTEAVNHVGEENKMLERFVFPLSIDSISGLLEKFPSKRELASLYIRKTYSLPYTERDYAALDSIARVFDLDTEVFSDVSLPVIKKKEYQIAALLPFMFDSLANPGRVLQNSLVTDLHQGMLMAAEDLAREGKPVQIIPYDTKRDGGLTNTILQSPGFTNTDLIVGPLYSDPVKIAQDYALENQLNMINPVSSTSEIIGRNSYSFLFKPTTETQARALAEQVIAEATNKNLMIFYESNERDSIAACEYREKMEEAGFLVNWMTSIGEENAKRILDTLVAQYDVFLTKEEADSIMNIPNRVVKTRRIRIDELHKMWASDPDDSLAFFLPISYDDNNREIVYYEKQFYMEKDSIGHFFGAINSNALASNLVSAVEIRADSTQIYTYGNWLDFTMADYNQFERLGITMARPDYIDKERANYKDLSERISQRFKTIPSIYHFTGYELIWFVGQKLHSHGKYFQLGLRDGRFNHGKIFEGTKYGSANDNQVVPVVRFEETELKVVNRELYENRAK